MAAGEPRFSARFGHYGWCWPRGPLDLLLKAALVPDDEIALGHARTWLDRHDIATATFRDHRLLTAVSGRFGAALAGHPAYPRLTGLRRQLWTKSRMAAHEAAPVLRAFSDAGIALLLTKGASRVALDPAAETLRVAHDIDVVVGPEKLEPAFLILAGSGWQPSSGASLKHLVAQLPSTQSMNFFRGNVGDVDLHRDAYPGERDEADEERMWRQAEEATFHGISVLVPAGPDRAALAIAHGALAAHAHSDWMIDCAVALRAPEFAWPAFVEIVARRRMWVAATAVLSYLAVEIGLPVPAAVLDGLVTAADAVGPLGRLASLLEAKPRTDTSLAIDVARWVAKKARQRRERSSRDFVTTSSERSVLRGRKVYRLWPTRALASPLATSHRLPLPPAGPCGCAIRLSLLVEVAVPPAARRIEMEVNGPARHVARLRYRKIGRRRGLLRLRYDGEVRVDAADGELTIEARPIRQVRETETGAAFARSGALPFRLLAVRVGRTKAAEV